LIGGVPLWSRLTADEPPANWMLCSAIPPCFTTIFRAGQGLVPRAEDALCIARLWRCRWGSDPGGVNSLAGITSGCWNRLVPGCVFFAVLVFGLPVACVLGGWPEEGLVASARFDAVEFAAEWLANSQTIRIAAWTARTASDQPT
jgi:hypothetical protein